MMNYIFIFLGVILNICLNAHWGKCQELPESFYVYQDDTEGILPWREPDDFQITQDDSSELNTNDQETKPPFSSLLLQRLSRQKTCKWTGCHKLPLTLSKESSCPKGSFLESYKVCDPRGSGNIDVQCCQ